MSTLRSKKPVTILCTHACGLLLLCLGLGLFSTPEIRAQQLDEQTGIDQGNYNIKQSIEFGYRFSNVNGSQETYDTMVNLQQGPRLLGFTTEFRSLDHHATFFDNLYLSNFGYGGDPNDVSQIRISKIHWYAFTGMFRKDQNYWDYSLLANPLNPLTTVPNAPLNFNPIINAPPNVVGTPLIGTSPHSYYTRRNMQNYNLTILPDSKIRFRLGYDQNTVYGPGAAPFTRALTNICFVTIPTTCSNTASASISGCCREPPSVMTSSGASTKMIWARAMTTSNFLPAPAFPSWIWVFPSIPAPISPVRIPLVREASSIPRAARTPATLCTGGPGWIVRPRKLPCNPPISRISTWRGCSVTPAAI